MGGFSEVTLKARGSAISRAVNVAEIVKNRFLTDVEVLNINISTEEILNNLKDHLQMFAIEILLSNF